MARIFHSLSEMPSDWRATVVSIGNFDGVHCGHRHVLRNVVERAHALGAHSLAVTFDPHPARVLRPEHAPRLITPLAQKLAALEQSGVDAVLVLPFTEEFARNSPREFAQRVISDGLHAKEVHEGANFHFGHRAQGDCEQLRQLGGQMGFAVSVYPEMRVRGEIVSSSRIRQLLLEGEVSKARHLLGRPFSILSTPAKGRGYGSRYTVPTINLAEYAELVPRNGVYVTCTRIDSEQFHSVTNVGTRPTFAGASFAIETHLLDFHPLPLSEVTPVEISFLKWLRPEMQWPSPEALKQQIGKDVARAKRFLSRAASFQPPAPSS